MKKVQFNYDNKNRILAIREEAIKAKLNHVASGEKFKEDHYVVIDMRAPSFKKRFMVFNENHELVRQHHVSHGKNSNKPGFPVYATRFSNKWMSKQSSLGSFKTGKVYYGKHGRSLNLHGLDKGINHNAFKRRIVVHKAKYVTDGFILRNGRAGNSWGCPALDPAVCQKVIDLIRDGVFFYVAY